MRLAQREHTKSGGYSGHPQLPSRGIGSCLRGTGAPPPNPPSQILQKPLKKKKVGTHFLFGPPSARRKTHFSYRIFFKKIKKTSVIAMTRRGRVQSGEFRG